MWQTILEQFHNNQFLAGGGLLMVLGGIAAYCRALPGKVYNWLWDRLFMEIEIQMKDDSFFWFSAWLAEHGYSKRWARNLTVFTRNRKSESRGMPEVQLTPSPGRHFLLWRGRPVIVHRDRQEAAGTGSGGLLTKEPRETYNISILTRSREVCQQLLAEAYDVANPMSDLRINLLMARYGEWHHSTKLRPRPLDSVFLCEGLLDSILEDMRWFLRSEEWYVNRGIPYRRGYLLYGPPGNGKSSTVKALASALKLDVCVLNLGSIDSDNDLTSLFADMPHHCVVLLEDIDCVTSDRETKKKDDDDSPQPVSLSALLNALDGVAAKEGRLMFMTTNHVEKLDQALIRPGRCDMQVFIDNASPDQAKKIFMRFFQDEEAAEDFSALLPPGTSMAALQGILLTAKTPDEAIREIQRANCDLQRVHLGDENGVGSGEALCDSLSHSEVPSRLDEQRDGDPQLH